MARSSKATQQSQQEEAHKARKRSKGSEAQGASKVNPAIQRTVVESGDPHAVLDLQQTIGNKAVGRCWPVRRGPSSGMMGMLAMKM